jgi:hypothetical protein
MTIKRITVSVEAVFFSVAVAVVIPMTAAPASADVPEIVSRIPFAGPDTVNATDSTTQCVTNIDAAGDSSITCTARAAAITTTLSCDSTRAISQSGSLYTVFPHTCSGQISGIGSADASFNGDSPVTIDTATGTVNAVNTEGFSGNFTENGSTIHGDCTGSALSETLAPFTASIGNASCTTTVDVIGVAAATVTGNGSTLRIVTSPDVAATITGPALAVTTSTALIGPRTLACATSVTINLGANPPVSATPC